MAPDTVCSVGVAGIGLLGPGLPGWAAARGLLANPAQWRCTPTEVPASTRLPPTERRRAGAVVKASLVVADEACAGAGLDPALLATVFASSTGDPLNCHLLCEALAQPQRLVSPTRFTNSVHNAPAGYWHIAAQSTCASTSLAAFDASFGAGLLEAAVQCASGGEAVLLVACDMPYPEPLHALRPLADGFAVALVLVPAGRGAASGGGVALPLLSLLSLPVGESSDRLDTPCADPGLEGLRQSIPAARALPFLCALASATGEVSLVIDDAPGHSSGWRLHAVAEPQP
ncbi:MAG: beta-ketoacyl synthase chain length factor [Rubrivivax sp.]